MTPPRIAIIGAGLSGLACARRLQDAGLAVELFDKSHRPGGRMASRQLLLADGHALIDHGAQFFTARTPAFQELCREALEAGVLAPWRGLLRDDRTGATGTASAEARYLGSPDMNALPRWLARGLAVHCASEVTGLARERDCWSLAFASCPPATGFSAVVVAVPAEQAAVLLSRVAPRLAAEAGAARSAPCWAGLFAFESTTPWPDWQALRPAEGHTLSWLARSHDGRGLVVHAAPNWSRAHLEEDATTVRAMLLKALAELAPDLGTPRAAIAHCWRHALVETASGSAYGLDASLSLGVCGDWRLGPRVELAWASGDTLGTDLPGLLGNSVLA